MRFCFSDPVKEKIVFVFAVIKTKQKLIIVKYFEFNVNIASVPGNCCHTSAEANIRMFPAERRYVNLMRNR